LKDFDKSGQFHRNLDMARWHHSTC